MTPFALKQCWPAQQKNQLQGGSRPLACGRESPCRQANRKPTGATVLRLQRRGGLALLTRKKEYSRQLSNILYSRGGGLGRHASPLYFLVSRHTRFFLQGAMIVGVTYVAGYQKQLLSIQRTYNLLDQSWKFEPRNRSFLERFFLFNLQSEG